MRATLIALLATLPWIASPARAQDPPPCLLTGGFSVSYALNTYKNVPFTAIAKMTFDQQLSNGNTIRTVLRTRQARDSTGRTMKEVPEGCVRAEDGQLHEKLSISVNDPATKTVLTWPAHDSQAAAVTQVLQMASPAPRPLTPEQQAAMAQQVKQDQISRNEFKYEQLGMKLISGVEATGTRSTQTIPAGAEGNELPLSVTQEIWRTRDLIVLAITDDPRRGKSTFEYEELNFGEPDPAIFIPPPDNKVQDITPNRPPSP